jgi:hypothetical protein
MIRGRDQTVWRNTCLMTICYNRSDRNCPCIETQCTVTSQQPFFSCRSWLGLSSLGLQPHVNLLHQPLMIGGSGAFAKWYKQRKTTSSSATLLTTYRSRTLPGLNLGFCCQLASCAMIRLQSGSNCLSYTQHLIITNILHLYSSCSNIGVNLICKLQSYILMYQYSVLCMLSSFSVNIFIISFVFLSCSWWKFYDLLTTLYVAAPYSPLASPAMLFPGTWYLESIDKMHRRKYKRVPQEPA